MTRTHHKLKLFAVVAAVPTVLTAGVAAFYRSGKDALPQLTTAAATRGDIVQTVDATGTLEAVTTVQVGTQVSGTVKTLHAVSSPRGS
jgi:HlyD family secretion protein